MVGILVPNSSGDFRYEQPMVTKQLHRMVHSQFCDKLKNAPPENFFEKAHELIGVGAELPRKARKAVIFQKCPRKVFL